MNEKQFHPVAVYKQLIEEHKEWILAATTEHFKETSDVYLGHFVFAAIVDRTLSNIHGFLKLCEEKNFLCAASILRQQIDTAMRANAFSLVTDRNELAEKIFSGVRFSKIVDADGKKMQDFYLRGRLAEKYPWIEQVYEETSGTVHFSEKHILSAISDVNKTGEMEFLISGLSTRPMEDFLEIFAAFEHSIRMTYEVLFPDRVA